MLLQKWLPFTDGWNNLCAKSGNYFQSGRYFKLLWSEKCRIRGIGSVWDYEVSIMSSLLASDILCFMGYWECRLLSYYCLVLPKRCHIILPQNLKEVEWNKYGHGITNLWFISSVGQEWAVPCVISLWAHVSSDKSSRLNWSNEQTILTSLSDTKVSQTRECENLAAVQGGQAVTHLWLRQTSDSPSDKCVCFLSHANQTLGLALVCDWFWLLPCVTLPWLWSDVGASAQERVGCPAGQSCPDTCLPARLGMRAASCFPLPLTRPCSSRAYIKSDRNSDFLALLVSAVSALWQRCLEDCSRGSEDRESCNLWEVTEVSAGLTQRRNRSACSGLGNCSLSSSACFRLVMALRDGNHDPGIYTSVLVESDFAVCFICSSCVINSNAELNTVQFTCFCKIYTVLALIVVFPYLVQTHAERNAQNWSPS